MEKQDLTKLEQTVDDSKVKMINLPFGSGFSRVLAYFHVRWDTTPTVPSNQPPDQPRRLAVRSLEQQIADLEASLEAHWNNEPPADASAAAFREYADRGKATLEVISLRKRKRASSSPDARETGAIPMRRPYDPLESLLKKEPQELTKDGRPAQLEQWFQGLQGTFEMFEVTHLDTQRRTRWAARGLTKHRNLNSAVTRRFAAADEPLLWKEYVQLCTDTVRDPAVRRVDAARAFHSAVFRNDQTVEEFVAHVERVRDQLSYNALLTGD
ncbi:hypothetical protein LTR10_007573 [Elasticomyces elasticus]|nr:hypothetical protein LTR10_007573 [Elasticomyces elasticus]KAK4970577.1 hypothetical protein LTR42_007552 [Elasticomyces elasticus]